MRMTNLKLLHDIQTNIDTYNTMTFRQYDLLAFFS